MNLKNVTIAIICFVILVIGVQCCTMKKPQSSNTPTSKQEQTSIQQIKLTGLDGINYPIKGLPESTVTYLKTKSQFKDLYTDKKFAIYYVGADCPYAQAFINAIDPLKSSTEYTDKYNFFPKEASGIKQFDSMEDAQADVNFSNTCREFCIVNPAKNQIFAIDGIGNEEAAQLGSIFEQLKDW